jgi:hypothetical protein
MLPSSFSPAILPHSLRVADMINLEKQSSFQVWVAALAFPLP